MLELKGNDYLHSVFVLGDSFLAVVYTRENRLVSKTFSVRGNGIDHMEDSAKGFNGIRLAYKQMGFSEIVVMSFWREMSSQERKDLFAYYNMVDKAIITAKEKQFSAEAKAVPE